MRTPQEFAGSSYPKAKNIPLDTLPSRMADLPKDKPIVLYCASGARSAQAARILKRAGFHRRDQRRKSGKHAEIGAK